MKLKERWRELDAIMLPEPVVLGTGAPKAITT